MAQVEVSCPYCTSTNSIKKGFTRQGKQRYVCQNENCSRSTFILDYTHQGYLPEVKEKIFEMSMNGSGVRDTSRVLKISQNTVLSELKKKR